jgi:hypothetical protein
VAGIAGGKTRALITRAVTRGLNPAAPLRNSGFPWLGQVPKHWRVERSKWLFKERDERIENDDGEMLTVSHITGVTKRSEKDVNMFEAETTEGYKICLKGDLAINTLWAWMAQWASRRATASSARPTMFIRPARTWIAAMWKRSCVCVVRAENHPLLERCVVVAAAAVSRRVF